LLFNHVPLSLFSTFSPSKPSVMLPSLFGRSTLTLQLTVKSFFLFDVSGTMIQMDIFERRFFWLPVLILVGKRSLLPIPLVFQSEELFLLSR
jgi:hypothetical protein